jgi:hypothetical protein
MDEFILGGVCGDVVDMGDLVSLNDGNWACNSGDLGGAAQSGDTTTTVCRS